MKLFLKEQRLLIIVQLIQCFIILLLFILDGSAQLSIVLYSLFISFFIFICYLAHRYVSHRSFYKRLSKPMNELNESLQHLSYTSLARALRKLLMTQYKQYKKQILKTKQKQEEHLIFVDRWVHQMKTPLSVLELMAKDLDEPEASSFKEELDRLKVGLETSLHMARLRTLEQDFHIKRVSLLSITQDVISENKRNFIRNQVYPNMIEKSRNLIIETDEKWLFFIIDQLIHNAIKYSKGKSKTINIIFDMTEQRPTLVIEDFGIGIPKEDLRRVFDLFYTGENGRKYRESTGVGLYIVKEVINYLNHSIDVISTPKKGTTFYIKF